MVDQGGGVAVVEQEMLDGHGGGRGQATAGYGKGDVEQGSGPRQGVDVSGHDGFQRVDCGADPEDDIGDDGPSGRGQRVGGQNRQRGQQVGVKADEDFDGDDAPTAGVGDADGDGQCVAIGGGGVGNGDQQL